ncbi:MAG: hypothetical protein KJ000_18925 [Pirellulaceae bacterium]|nr:hypothetical protein [Pirellulaceae bacterium]
MWCLAYVSPESFLPILSVISAAVGGAMLLGRSGMVWLCGIGRRIIGRRSDT